MAFVRSSALMMCAVAACLSALGQDQSHVLPEAPKPNAMPLMAGQGGTIRRDTTTMPTQSPVVMARLSGRQKYALAYRRIVSVQTPLKAAFDSGFEMAAGTGPDLPRNGLSAFAKRVGYNSLNISTTIFFDTAFVPALMHQDPRYPVLGEGPVKTRVMWAIKHEFVAFGDDGREMPNYGNLVGFGLASLTTNAYAPGDGRGFGDMAEGYLINIGVSTGLNVVREFKVFDRVKTIVHHSKADTD
jgi:hypothetical protein